MQIYKNMTKEELDNYFEILDRYQQLISELKNMKIDWETDISKMDFSKLHNFYITDRYIIERFKIEYRKVDEIYYNSTRKTDLLNISYTEKKRYINLIKLIKDGIKIIPPSRTISHIMKDGKIIDVNGTEHHCDGAHRIELSMHLGLEIIPFIISRYISEHRFTASKWLLNYDDEVLKLTERKNTRNVIELKMKYWIFDESSDGESLLFRLKY
jgi:hypothetical protein